MMHLSSMYLFILCFEHACEISCVNFIFIGAEFMDCENITFSSHIIHSPLASLLSSQYRLSRLLRSLISIKNFSLENFAMQNVTNTQL